MKTILLILKHFSLLETERYFNYGLPFNDFHNQAFGYNFVKVPMSPLDLLNCNIIVYPTEGTLLFANVIMTVYYESIRVFLVEPTQKTNAIICRFMFGYKTKDLLFLLNDPMLFGICHREWDNRGRTNITWKPKSAITHKTECTQIFNWEPFQIQLILVPPTSLYHALL